MFWKHTFKFMKNCLAKLSVPGSSYLIDSTLSIFEKIIWVFVLLLAIGTAIWLSWTNLMGYKYPFETNVDDLNSPISEIPFPTVTVCPVGRKVPDKMALFEKIWNSEERLSGLYYSHQPLMDVVMDIKNLTYNKSISYIESITLETADKEDLYDDETWNQIQSLRSPQCENSNVWSNNCTNYEKCKMKDDFPPDELLIGLKSRLHSYIYKVNYAIVSFSKDIPKVS